MTDQAPDAGGDDAAEALSIVRELKKLIEAILERLTDAVKYGKRTRLMSWLLVASVVLDVAAYSLAGIALIHERQDQAAIHAAQLHACAIGNQFRAGQVQLWDHVIAVSRPPAHETAAARDLRLDTLAAFRAYIAHQFRPVPCARLYRT